MMTELTQKDTDAMFADPYRLVRGPDRTLWVCRKCQTCNSIDAVTCERCGAAIEESEKAITETKPCPKCGEANTLGACRCIACQQSFCRGDGDDVEAMQQPYAEDMGIESGETDAE